MNRSLRLLYLGFLVRDQDIQSIFAGELHPQYSALRFQRNLLRALEGAGAAIDAITTPPIASFPRNRHWWVPGAQYQISGLDLRGRQISVPNLPGVRLLSRLVQLLRCGLVNLRTPADGILVYSVHTPMVLTAVVLKALRGLPVFVVINDLPTLMGGPSHFAKRLLKRVDAAIVRRLLGRADGAFPVTDGTGRDWLTFGPRYWPMEGVSDEAAAALQAARANRSYIARGSDCPILLYTGALENVVRFADAFHRSPIRAKLVFVGGGIDRSRLETLATADERIEVKPFMTGDALAREVQRADFMINPRDPAWPGASYSFPWKLFDYLITGKPIISTRLPGIPVEYFDVFRPVDLVDQPSFEASLKRALSVDKDPEQIWRGTERLARRLASCSVGVSMVEHMRAWSRSAAAQ